MLSINLLNEINFERKTSKCQGSPAFEILLQRLEVNAASHSPILFPEFFGGEKTLGV